MNHAKSQSTALVPTLDRKTLSTVPCGFCAWCLFNLKWHGRAYLSLCTRRRSAS
jgi:hypothetical protein